MPDKSFIFVEGTRLRAPRAKVIDPRIWKQFKEVLHDLYYKRNLSVQDVENYMFKYHHFKATGRQYGRQFHDKWKWPKKRSTDAEIIVQSNTVVSSQQALNTALGAESPLIQAQPQSLIWNSSIEVEVADGEVCVSAERCCVPDDYLDSDAADLCSLETSSTTPSSRSFSRSAPATPDISESLPVPFVRSRLHFASPSRNAFRPETPELYALQESEYEDIQEIFQLFPAPSEKPQLSERAKKSIHRNSSVIGNVLNVPSVEWSSIIEEDFVPPPLVADSSPPEISFAHVDPTQRSFLITETDGIDKNGSLQESSSCLWNPEPRAAALVPHSQYSHGTSHEHDESDPTLFPHQYEKNASCMKTCCWPEVARKTLAQCAVDRINQVEPGSITSNDRCFTTTQLSSERSKADAILEVVGKIVSRIDHADVEMSDVTKIVRFANFLSAARFFDDSFNWGFVIWNVLNKRDDTLLATSQVYYQRAPPWLLIFTNMAKSCTGPEHLQLLAAAIEDVQILDSFSTDRSHSSASALYALLGEALQRLSGLEDATDAALGCWMSMPTASLSFPNYLVRRVIELGIKTAKACSQHPSYGTQQRLDDILPCTETNPEQEAIASSLERCVRKILAWCKAELEHKAFSEMVDGIDESFWVRSTSPLDVARFERLAVYGYLCRCLWSQEHLDDQMFWMERVDVVSALQTMTEYTGLTNEAALGAVLGMARPILQPSTSPERATMAHRFAHSMETLCNDTVMEPSGFGNVGHKMSINDIMDRYCWAGNSKASLDEFDDPEYARKTGVFVREEASRGLEISSSRAFQPVLGDLREGHVFCQDTLMRSPRLSEVSTDRRSMWSLHGRIKTARKTSRSSGNSCNYKCYGSEEHAAEFDLESKARYCPSAWNTSNTSLAIHRLSEQLQTGLSLDANQSKHVSTSSSQMVWSRIEEEKEAD